MRSLLELDLTYLEPVVSTARLEEFVPILQQAQKTLETGSGPGSDNLGWLTLPEQANTSEMEHLREAAERIRNQAEVLLVVGIGGSYLGARAALEYLTSPYYNLNSATNPQIFFVGNNLSATMLHQVLQIVGERDFAVNVVSKSGTTAEPAIAFHILRQRLEWRYGEEGARERIYATTDHERGALRNLARDKGYTTFAIPHDVGGRYSLLTAAGLLPLLVAGIDVAEILRGAAAIMPLLRTPSLVDNPAWLYAAARHALLATGRGIELFGTYEPAARQLTEWWKQLFGESEGKDGKGIFPATLELTADLHSMGQYIQEGPRQLFCTLLEIAEPSCDERLSAAPDEVLGYLDGLSLNELNRMVRQAACVAHRDGGAPSIIIRTLTATPRPLGALIFFFEYACALSGYMLGVNPFDQPGVEAYKRELNALIQGRERT